MSSIIKFMGATIVRGLYHTRVDGLNTFRKSLWLSLILIYTERSKSLTDTDQTTSEFQNGFGLTIIR
jgi:hypothetical protein